VEEILQEFLLGVDLALLEIFGGHGGDGVWDTLAEQGHLLTLLLLVDLGEDLSESLDWLLCLNGHVGKNVNERFLWLLFGLNSHVDESFVHGLGWHGFLLFMDLSQDFAESWLHSVLNDDIVDQATEGLLWLSSVLNGHVDESLVHGALGLLLLVNLAQSKPSVA
jgi:hypothetical protein